MKLKKLKKGKKKAYKSRYQAGGLQGVPTNLSDTTLTPIQRGQQLGLLSIPQNIIQQNNARQNAIFEQSKLRNSQNSVNEQKILNQRNAARPDPSLQQGPKYFQAGGMYGSNTVSSSGQGSLGNTSSIVYQESNPAILEEKLKAKKANEQLLMQQSSDMAAKVEQMDAQAEADIQTAADKVKAKDQATSSIIQGSIKAGKTTGLIDKKAGSLGLGDAAKAYKGARLATQGANLSQTAIAGAKGTKFAADAAKQGYQVMSSAKTGKTILVDGAGNAVKAGSGVGAGLSALNNANVYALAANYAGKGIKSLSDDDDATTWTAGEATGDVLSKAGEYAGYGAMATSWLGPGAALGAGIGAVIGTGVGIYQGLTGRKKARKAEADALALKKKRIGKYNKELGKSFASQKARVNAAQLAQKTYSGYDLGQNVVARKGGMRMGMPRYGYAS
jgi:hypothetical protein